MLKPDQARSRKLAAATIMAAPRERVLPQWNQFERQSWSAPSPRAPGLPGRGLFYANRGRPELHWGGLGIGRHHLAPAICVYAANMVLLALTAIGITLVIERDIKRRLVSSGRLEFGVLIASALLSVAIGLYSPGNAMYAYFLNFASPLVGRLTKRCAGGRRSRILFTVLERFTKPRQRQRDTTIARVAKRPSVNEPAIGAIRYIFRYFVRRRVRNKSSMHDVQVDLEDMTWLAIVQRQSVMNTSP
jgi:hypothetical protein